MECTIQKVTLNINYRLLINNNISFLVSFVTNIPHLGKMLITEQTGKDGEGINENCLVPIQFFYKPKSCSKKSII